MTKEEIYQKVLLMTYSEREDFKAFLLTLLESEDTAPLPTTYQEESV